MKNKNTVRGTIILGIALAAWLVIVLVVPFVKNAAYWLSFVFTLLAFAAQLYVFKISFRNGESVRSKFYGFPIARIGVMYLAVQLVLGLLVMALAKWLPAWIGVILFVITLAVAAVGCIAADMMRDEVERQDVHLKKDVSHMRAMQSKAIALVNQCDAPALKNELEKLAEDFRFSDPVSSEALADIEASLSACLDELQRSLTDGDMDSATVLCHRAKTVLVERNRLCKLNK